MGRTAQSTPEESRLLNESGLRVTVDIERSNLLS